MSAVQTAWREIGGAPRRAADPNLYCSRVPLLFEDFVGEMDRGLAPRRPVHQDDMFDQARFEIRGRARSGRGARRVRLLSVVRKFRADAPDALDRRPGPSFLQATAIS